MPDLVLCSAARRTRQTWQYVGAELGGESSVSFDPRLYPAGARELLDVIAEAPAGAGTLLYVGHNPAAADLTEILTGRPADLPTAATAVIGTDVSWAGLAEGAGDGAGRLLDYWTPRADQ
jgi:phosphohistidine phosphatase